MCVCACLCVFVCVCATLRTLHWFRGHKIIHTHKHTLIREREQAPERKRVSDIHVYTYTNATDINLHTLQYLFMYASERGNTERQHKVSSLGSNTISGTSDAQALKRHFPHPPAPPPLSPVCLWPVSSLRTCGLGTLAASHENAGETPRPFFFFCDTSRMSSIRVICEKMSTRCPSVWACAKEKKSQEYLATLPQSPRIYI